MSRFMDFDAAMSENVRPEFTLGGQKFTCKAKLPWKKFSHLIISMSETDSVSSDGIDKTEEFLRIALLPQDRERFFALVNSDGDDENEDYAGTEQIGELVKWLLGEYTGKAETTSDDSSGTSDTSGRPANVVSLNPKKGNSA